MKPDSDPMEGFWKILSFLIKESRGHTKLFADVLIITSLCSHSLCGFKIWQINYFTVSKTNLFVELLQSQYFSFGETCGMKNIFEGKCFGVSFLAHLRPRISALNESLMRITVMCFICSWKRVKENLGVHLSILSYNFGFYILFPILECYSSF